MERQELQKELRASRDELDALIADLPDEDFHEPGVMNGWTLKDVLAHLNRWEGELVTMLFELKGGKEPSRAEIQGEENIDRLNAKWYEEDKNRKLDLVLNDFRGLRQQTLRRIEEFSEGELNQPDRFPALRGEPLWRWIAVDTYEHEAEHTEFVRGWLELRE